MLWKDNFGQNTFGKNMKTHPYDIYWNEAKNWKWHLVYVCKDDPRVIVPKKPKWAGRTLNFAHRKSFLVLFLTILAVAIPFVLHGHIRGASSKSSMDYPLRFGCFWNHR